MTQTKKTSKAVTPNATLGTWTKKSSISGSYVASLMERADKRGAEIYGAVQRSSQYATKKK